MKEERLKYVFLFSAVIIKFLISLILFPPILSFIYSFVFGIFGYFLLKYNMKLYTYLMLIFADFFFCFVTVINIVGVGIMAIINSFIYFVFSGFFFYLILIENFSRKTNNKRLTKISNIEVDKGIKALESNDYQSAVDYFLSAIKENKSNYLGYMGMCNTLTKFDKDNLKKIKYYKKKCIKYAPRELKDSINAKF